MMKKRLLATVLSMMIATLMSSGCGSKQESPESTQNAGNTETTKSTETTEEGSAEKTFKIGYHNFASGVGSLDLLERYARVAYEEWYGYEFMGMNDEGSPEKSISNLNNAIAADANVDCFFGVSDALFQSALKTCEEADVYFAGYSQQPYDEGVIQQLQDSEYFVGLAADDNYGAGYSLGEFAAEQGYKTAVVTGDEVGSPNQDLKIQGFTDAFEKGGGEVVGVCRVASADSAATVSQTDDLIVANPDVDCMYSAHGEVCKAFVENMAKHPDADIKVLCSDVDTATMEYLRDGRMVAGNGGQFVGTIYNSILVYNALNGHTLVNEEGKAEVMAIIPFCMVTKETVDLYQKFWIDQVPISYEDIADLLITNNPDVDLAYFKEKVGQYTIENVLRSKFESGEISEQELKDVGISVS